MTLAAEPAQGMTRALDAAPPVAVTETAYAGLVTRAVAFVIDAAIVDGIAAVAGAAGALVLSLFHVSGPARTAIAAVGGALFVAWAVGYFTTFWATTGQTIGNRVMQIRVTRPDGTGLHWRRSLVRVIGLVLAALPLFAGFVPVLFTERRRGLADWIADTVVVWAPPEGHA